jgi:hypothetical protein
MQKIDLRFYSKLAIDVRFGVKQVDVEVPLVVGDTGPRLEFNCINYFTNEPQDLTNKSVYFSMRLSGQNQYATPKTLCSVSGPGVSGVAVYDFASGDLLYPGTYFGDLSITDGSVTETAPEAVRFLVRERNER